MRFKMNSASFATRTIWSFIACERSLPSLISSINANPACFWREFCHSWEHNNITSSTTELLFLKVVSPKTRKHIDYTIQSPIIYESSFVHTLKVRNIPLPSDSNSCPCEPNKVFDKNGAKSTIISLSKGQTDPRAASNFCVRLDSLAGVGKGNPSADMSGFIFNSSALGTVEEDGLAVELCIGEPLTTLICPWGFSPRSKASSFITMFIIKHYATNYKQGAYSLGKSFVSLLSDSSFQVQPLTDWHIIFNLPPYYYYSITQLLLFVSRIHTFIISSRTFGFTIII